MYFFFFLWCICCFVDASIHSEEATKVSSLRCFCFERSVAFLAQNPRFFFSCFFFFFSFFSCFLFFLFFFFFSCFSPPSVSPFLRFTLLLAIFVANNVFNPQIMAAGQPPQTAAKTEQGVQYMSIETDDGHLFIFDKGAAQKYSGTLRSMIEAQTVLDSAEGMLPQKRVSMKIAEHTSPAIDGILEFLYFRKKWVAPAPNWAPPKFKENLCKEMLVAAHFLEC